MHDTGQVNAGSGHVVRGPDPCGMSSQMIDRPDWLWSCVLRIQQPSDALDNARYFLRPDGSGAHRSGIFHTPEDGALGDPGMGNPGRAVRHCQKEKQSRLA
jgi:hypothetical protein